MSDVTVEVEQTWVAEFRFQTASGLVWAPGAVFSDAEAAKRTIADDVESAVTWREVHADQWGGRVDGWDLIRLYKIPVNPAGIVWYQSPPAPTS